MSEELRAACDAVNVIIDEYLDGYEMYGEDADGRDGTYTPTEHERILIADAIHGLLADDDFVARFNCWQDMVRASGLPN